MDRITAIRGMHDLLPDASARWQALELVLRELVARYGYSEIRTPIVESTALFARSIGEATDIVEKEMYSFADRNGDGLTLRPEGTASCVRAAIEHALVPEPPRRLWYMGPMFRHERPQKGRYRQFHQLGVEAFGLAGPDIDVELIAMTARLWRELGLGDQVGLRINTLGRPEERASHRAELIAYFREHFDVLDEDSRNRLERNPLRILDTKNPRMRALVEAAPKLEQHLGERSRAHFEGLCTGLEAAGIAYVVDPLLVRGLDYYTDTVFEWVTDTLGAQGTVCAGGRYDGLVGQLGGPATPAVGFALGIERLLGVLEAADRPLPERGVDVYWVLVGEQATMRGPALAEQLRDAAPALRVVTHCGGGSFKSQFKKADRSGAHYAIVLGDDELARGVAGLKPLRGNDAQSEVALDALADVLRASMAD
ncbi:MAG: histidine--tRNA ligase [Chromatiales bacterium]|nr:histidine--tRNA ligase [Chromatiales bacterium]